MSPPQTDAAAARRARPSAARRALFLLTALALPLLFFALLELALRVAGQRVDYPLFVASPGQAAYRQASPEVIKRFFSDPSQAPTVSIETGYFLASKPARGFRIAVQGGSSAAGFPYGYGASLAGMLEQRLRRVTTDRPVEVVSTAMSAVNSYTLLDFADETIAQRPDVVLIYAGHNEYLGVLGVGSALSSGLSPALTRLTLRLRRFAVYQLIERLFAPRANDTQSTESAPGRTLMARIARDKAIAFDSARYRRGLEQYRGNLERLLGRYRRAGVPVLIGTLASNERDLPPFVSALAEGVDAARFATHLAAAEVALDAGTLDTAQRALDLALALDDGSASAWYVQARLQVARGDAPAARQSFLRAKDLDQLRFRAPEAFNRIVRDSAAAYGATLVEVQRALASAAPDGIIGNSLMLEHVHPNLDGYFVLADAYFDGLFEAGLLSVNGELPGDAQARDEIPVSAVDRLFGEYKLERVINDWPFVDTPREPQIPAPTNDIENLAFQMYRQRIAWPQATSRLLQIYRTQGNLAEETRVALILADAFPFVPAPQFSAGTALIRAGRPQQAGQYLERAVSYDPNNVNALLALAHALVLSGKADAASRRLQQVLELEPGNATAVDALEQLARRGGG